MSQIYKYSADGGGVPIETINGDVGSISGSTVTIYADQAANQAGASVKFVNAGTVSTFEVTDANGNTFIGKSCGNSTVSGTDNVGLGDAFTLAGLTSGEENTAIGSGCLENIKAGSFNTGIGSTAGSSYTGSESSNIIINNQGTTGDNNTIRIGTQGSAPGGQNKAFIAGIVGVTVSNAEAVTINSSTGQMGVTPLTGSRVLIQSITAAASSSIDFTTGVTGYSQYEVEWFTVITTGTTLQNIQFSTNAGSSWEATNYNYANDVAYPNAGGPQGFTGQTSIVISTAPTDSATFPWSGYTKFQNFSTALNKSCYGQSVGQFNGCLQFQHSGYWIGAGVVNGIRFIPDAGSFTSGTFNLYGIP